jgi:hypothetical protein
MKHLHFRCPLFMQLKQVATLFSFFFFLVGLLSCGKEESIEQSARTDYQWEFKEEDSIFKGNMDTVFIDNSLPAKRLMILGTSVNGRFFFLSITGFDNKKVATYKSPNIIFTYLNNTDIQYQNNPAGVGDFTVTIDKIDSLNVSGTFYGSAKDSAGRNKQIAEGKFHTNYFTPVTTPIVITPPAVIDSGRVTFWSKNSCNGGSINVKLSNSTRPITTFTPTAPVDCITSGMANFSLPVGLYTWTSYCGADSLTGNVTVTKGQCVKKEIVFYAPAGQFSLAGSPDSCSNASVQGSYVVGTPLNSTNKVAIRINVLSPGSYTITTSTVNNISFSASGTFSTTGIQTVVLNGKGQPASAGTTQLPIIAGNSNCSFAVIVTAAPNPPPAGANGWRFTEGGKTFSRVYPGTWLVTFGDDYLPSGKKAVNLYGTTTTGDTVMQLYIQLPATATQPIPGTYITDPNLFSLSSTDFEMYTGTLPSFQNVYMSKTQMGALYNVHMTIKITSYNATTKIIIGTFSGNCWNETGSVVNITNGSFTATVTQ